MQLSEPIAVVVAALITGVLTGGPALWLARRKPELRSTNRRITDQWQKQARELDERLSAQYERQIAYLEAQIENRDREIESLRERPRGSDHA